MTQLQGQLHFMPISDLLLWVSNRKITATMRVHHIQKECVFLFRQGILTRSLSNDPREYLGQHLINYGYINEEQLQKAYETQQETHMPLGRVLLTIGAITEDQLERVINTKTRESILGVMGWNSGLFTLDVSVDLQLHLDGKIPIHIKEVHSEHLAREVQWNEIRAVLPSSTVICNINAQAKPPQNKDEQRIVLLFSQGKTLGEIGLEMRALDFALYSTVFNLIRRGILSPTYTSTPQADENDTRNAFSSLENILKPHHEVIELSLEDALVDEQTSFHTSVQEHKFIPSLDSTVRIPQAALEALTSMSEALKNQQWSKVTLYAQRVLEHIPNHLDAQRTLNLAEHHLKRHTTPEIHVDFHAIPQWNIDRKSMSLNHLSSKERYVLSRIDGKKTLAQIAAVSPIQKNELLRIVDDFIQKDILFIKH